ncbi:YitT family protein [Paenibacillus koleovorans]|uniref:YitT family protein n=1 Tax=Paenibacillus koleovorans TaxID=121608 RepID=UPI000FD77BDC|nr:YitT family protein [Paenibacillus koleovorans]
MTRHLNIRNAISLLLILFGAILVAAGFNRFLIPHQLLSGGVSGVAMIIGYYTEWNIGLLYLLFNIPIIVWGVIAVGRRFVLLSIVAVALTTYFMQVIPEEPFIQDPLLGAVFGGVLIGIGCGISLWAGGSSGGFDIVGYILSLRWNFPIGTAIFALNSGVVVMLGYLFNWDLALRSMLSIFVTGKVVDMIHIRQLKVTAFIVTRCKDQIVERLHRLPRGVTVIKTEGAYTKSSQDMLMTVTSRYELAELRKIIREIDPKAFVNIVETVDIIGEFRRHK